MVDAYVRLAVEDADLVNARLYRSVNISQVLRQGRIVRGLAQTIFNGEADHR